MPYPVAIVSQFFLWKLGYRLVKFTEYRGFVVRQSSRDRYRIGNVVAEQVDPDVQSVDKCPHLHQSLYLRLLYICAVLHFLI